MGSLRLDRDNTRDGSHRYWHICGCCMSGNPFIANLIAALLIDLRQAQEDQGPGPRYMGRTGQPGCVVLAPFQPWRSRMVGTQPSPRLRSSSPSSCSSPISLHLMPLWRNFAQIGSGASWMMFPSASFTDCSPNTLRRSSKEMRFFPAVTWLFRQSVQIFLETDVEHIALRRQLA
jgi:hypothetical protein